MGINPWNTYLHVHAGHSDLSGSPRALEGQDLSGNNYYGIIHRLQATLRSDNTVYAQMALDVGAEPIVDVAHRMGITSYLNADSGHRAGRSHLRGVPAGDGLGLRDPRQRRAARRAHDHPPDQGLAGQGDLGGQSQAHAGHLGGRRLRRHPHPPGRTSRAAPAPRPPSAVRRRARPGPLRTWRRLVLRLHAPPFHGGLDGPPRGVRSR